VKHFSLPFPVVSLCLAGCRAAVFVPDVVHTYPGPVLDVSQVAIVRGGLDDGSAFWARLSSYDFKSVGDPRNGYPMELHVLPGRHFFLITCEGERQFGFPGVKLEVKAGMTYEVRCSPVDNNTKARAFLLKEYLTMDPVRAAEQAATRELNANPGGFWTAWVATHGARACPDAIGLLTSESECTGAACRAPLLLSRGYQKNCQLDTDTRISLHQMRRRWEETAGTATSACLKETYRAMMEPRQAATLRERCEGEGKTEAALRDAVRRRSAQPGPPAPGTPR
jgi:hypothetical protein